MDVFVFGVRRCSFFRRAPAKKVEHEDHQRHPDQSSPGSIAVDIAEDWRSGTHGRALGWF